MTGMEEVGTYAVAARISEIWYFLPTIIAGSIFPRLLALQDSDAAAYQRRLADSIRYLLWLSLAIAVPLTLASPLLIVLLYGEEFRAAGLMNTLTAARVARPSQCAAISAPAAPISTSIRPMNCSRRGAPVANFGPRACLSVKEQPAGGQKSVLSGLCDREGIRA